MKFLVFLVLCFKGSLSSLCDGNFWNCTDGTAEFDVTAFTNAGFGPGGGFTTLTAKFEPSIKNVKFDTKDVKLGIMKLEGKNVQDIVMSGNITLEDLCPLLRTETALPSLKTVRLVNVHIHGFNFSQDCSNDELFAPLQDPVPNSVEITMDGAILEVNPSPDETLTFDILFNLKRLKMTDVNIRGVKAIFAPFGDSEKKKLFAAKLTFGDDQNEVYETRSDSNEVVKHSENIFDNVSGSGSGERATFVIVLIACFAYFLM